MPRTIFLDLYGVLADSRIMEPAYNRRMAEILYRRTRVGTFEAWRQVQDDSYVRYQAQGAALDARPGHEREGDAWVDAVAAMNADQMLYMFERMGLPPPPDVARLYEEVEAETVSGIDATYPDVRPALRKLKVDGHRLFLATNANRSNAEPALVGAGFRDLFEDVVVLEVAKAKKDGPYYWRRAFAFAKVEPPHAVAVDDVASYLDAAGELGARCVQVIRPEARDRRSRGRWPVIDSLAALPPLLRD